jgi:hypothetical protein
MPLALRPTLPRYERHLRLLSLAPPSARTSSAFPIAPQACPTWANARMPPTVSLTRLRGAFRYAQAFISTNEVPVLRSVAWRQGGEDLLPTFECFMCLLAEADD